MKIFRFYDSCCDWDSIEHLIIMAANEDEAIKIAESEKFDYTDIFEYSDKTQIIHKDYKWG